jgi:hypothetical protein
MFAQLRESQNYYEDDLIEERPSLEEIHGGGEDSASHSDGDSDMEEEEEKSNEGLLYNESA